MKKWIFVLVLLMPVRAFAFTEVLTNAIKNEEGMFFSYIINFESGKYLLTASDAEEKIRICTFDEADGAELTDVLETDKEEGLKIAVVKHEGDEYVMVSNRFYEIEDDTFRNCELDQYKTVIRIATVENGELNTHKNTIGASYNLLNKLKEEKIKAYNFIDRRNSMSGDDLQSLRNIIASAADIMSFDCKNYDTDTLMRYVLNTHRNFYVTVPYNKNMHGDKDGISLVAADYIDYIISELFNCTPTHPPINELVSRGYCYSGDNYMYTDAFNVSFATEICDIEAVYDVGEGVYYVIFGDIYTENGKSIPEYSYIILKEKESGYNILRLDMGGILLSENEVLGYAGVDAPKKYNWENTAAQVKQINRYPWIWAAAIAAVAVPVIMLFRRRKK